MKTYTVTTGIIGLENKEARQGDTVTESDFMSPEHLAWHLDNGSIEPTGDAADNGSGTGLSGMKIADLRTMATEMKIEFASDIKKGELAALIQAKIDADESS